MWRRINRNAGEINMNIYNFMNLQMREGLKGKSTIRKLNKPTKINLLMKKVYLN